MHDTLTPNEPPAEQLISRIETRAAELTAQAEAGVRFAAALKSAEDEGGVPASPALLARARAWLADPRSAR